jgi:hypothetical protein
VFEFLTAPAYEAPRAFDVHARARADVLAGFVRGNAVHADAPFHDEAARLRTRHAEQLGYGRIEPPHVALS